MKTWLYKLQNQTLYGIDIYYTNTKCYIIYVLSEWGWKARQTVYEDQPDRGPV